MFPRVPLTTLYNEYISRPKSTEKTVDDIVPPPLRSDWNKKLYSSKKNGDQSNQQNGIHSQHQKIIDDWNSPICLSVTKLKIITPLQIYLLSWFPE